MFKRLSAFLLIILCVLASGPTCNADTVTPVAPGIDLIKMQRTYSAGQCNITIIAADLSRPDVKFGVIYPKAGASQLQNVLEMAKSAGAAAAINGDFFVKESGTKGSAVGYNVSGGRMVSPPATEEKLATLAFDANHNSLLDYFTATMTLTLQNGMVLPVKNINKYDPLDGIVVYNSLWGAKSLGSAGTQVEAVVRNGIITEIRRDMPPADIPEDGYIIAGLTDYTNLFEMIHVGETIQFDIKLTPDFKAVEAVGGGTILVKDGQPYPFTHNITGYNPRSAIALDKTGKILYLVAVDGRGAGGSAGMTQAELRDFLISFGAYNALNLDGGGSTQIVSRVIGGDALSVQNRPSDGYLRPVANAAAVFSTAQGGTFEGILPDFPANAQVNAPVQLKVKAYDTAYLPMAINPADVKYEVSGVDGVIDGNVFTPKEPGIATITAYYKDAQAKGSITVSQSENPDNTGYYSFDYPNGHVVPYPSYVKCSYQLATERVKAGKSSGKLTFDFTERHAELQSAALQFDNPFTVPVGSKSMGLWVYGSSDNRQWLRAMLKDAEGNIQRVTLAQVVDWTGWKYVEADLSGISLPAQLTRLYVVQPSTDVNTAGVLYFDELRIKDAPAAFDINKSAGYKTAVAYTAMNSNTLLGLLENYKIKSSLRKYDAAALVNGHSKGGNLMDLKKQYSEIKGGTTVLYIDNSSGLSSDDGQWKWLLDQIDSATTPALMLIFNSKLDTDSAHAVQLQDKLAKAVVSKDISVFCVSPGDSSRTDKKDGVTYVTLQPCKANLSQLIGYKTYTFVVATDNGNVKFDTVTETLFG